MSLIPICHQIIIFVLWQVNVYYGKFFKEAIDQGTPYVRCYLAQFDDEIERICIEFLVFFLPNRIKRNVNFTIMKCQGVGFSLINENDI